MGTCLQSGFDGNEPSVCCFCLLEGLSAALRGQVMGPKKVVGVFVHREMEKYRTSDSAPCFPGDHSLRATLFCAVSSAACRACPSQPGASPKVPELQSTQEPLGLKSCPAVSPLPVRWAYLFYDRDMVHGSLLSRAPGGGHVGEEI